MKKCITILGCHRSGTSAVAGVINQLGINMGSRLMAAAEEDNEKGFFENLDIYNVNEGILKTLNTSWDGLFFLHDEWWKMPRLDSYRQNIIEIVEREFKDDSIFCIKDPRLSVLFPLWKDVFEDLDIDPVCILPIRNPLEVGNSLKKRNDFTIEKSLLLWMKCMTAAEYYSRPFRRYFLSFDDMLRDPEGTFTRIADRFDINYPRKWQDARRDIEAFLDPGLKHHNCIGDNVVITCPGFISRYYNLLSDLSGTDRLDDKINIDIEDIRIEFNEAHRMFYNEEIRKLNDLSYMAKDQTDKIQTSDVKLYKKNLISNEEMDGNGAVRVKVTVIVVNYNGKKYLESCFDSLLNMDRDNISLEIIMVDNLSQDDSVNYIRCKYPTIKVIENDLNNFARALNLGVRNASGDYVAFLNVDTRVEKNWIKGLLDVMLQDEKIGAVQSKILFEGGKINSVGVEERADFNYGDIGFCEEDYGQYEEVKEINSFSGGSVLLRRSCLESVGSIDEEFMMFFEDTDFSTRCKKVGWKIFYSPMSVVYHRYHGVASSELANYFCSRNRLLYLAKHFPTRLPKSIKTSSFYLNGEYDDLYQALIQAIKKLIDNNASEESMKVIEELKDIIIEIYGNEKTYDLFRQVEALIGIRKIKMGICDHLLQFSDDELSHASSLIQNPPFYLSHNTDLRYMAATLDKPVIAVFNQVSDVVEQLQKYKIELDDRLALLDDVSCRLEASEADREARLGVIRNREERLIKQEETYQLHLQAILTSTSWRLTAPFRRLSTFLRRIRKAI